MDESGTLAALLGGLRKSRGLGLTEAARRAGLGRTTLYQWETGLRAPRGKPLERLLDALGAPERLRAEALAKADPRHARLALDRRPLGRPVALGQVIRAMRLRRGLTQTDAARACGVGQSAFARLERGDDVPDAATLHAVGFALNGSPEETVALSLAQGGAGDAPKTPEEAVYASIDLRLGQESLHEVLQLGIEADAWWRSLRDPRWDVVVTSAMAKRALRYLYDGRLADAEATASEAVRRARRPEAKSEAVMALAVLERLSRERGDPPGRTIRVAEAWAEAIPVGPTPEGGSKAWATKLAARARGRAGDLKGALESLRPVADWYALEASGPELDHLVRNESADVLIVGGAPERALDLLRPDDSSLHSRIIDAGILLANGLPLAQEWRKAFREAAAGASPDFRRAIAGFEQAPESLPSSRRLFY